MATQRFRRFAPNSVRIVAVLSSELKKYYPMLYNALAAKQLNALYDLYAKLMARMILAILLQDRAAFADGTPTVFLAGSL